MPCLVNNYINEIVKADLVKAIRRPRKKKDSLKEAISQINRDIAKHRHIVMFIYKASSFIDKESLAVAQAKETEYIEMFEDLIKS